MPVYYVAHPVGGDVPGNLARARRWFAWLVEHEPDVAFSMPWLPYVEHLDEAVPGNRARGLRDDVTMVAGCDGIVLCGGRVSSGMATELAAARANGLFIADLTELGEEPPVGGVRTWRGSWPQRPALVDVLTDLEVATTEAKRWEIVARAAGTRIRELQQQLVNAGLAELRNNAPPSTSLGFGVCRDCGEENDLGYLLGAGRCYECFQAVGRP